MIRKLLATTAIATLVTTGAIAQTTTQQPADTTAPAATMTNPAATTEPAAAEQQMMTQAEGNLASNIIGESVYNGTGENAERIGEVNDIVIGADGNIQALVIGVGGFLGIGEKSVAVDFQALEFVLAADNTERWVLPTTADALNSAPDFVWEEDTPDDNMADPNAPADGGAMAPAAPAEGGAMAPAAPADGGAMAPAEPAEPADPAVAPAS